MGLHLDLESDKGVNLKPLLPRELETSVAGATGGGRGSEVAVRRLGEYTTGSVNKAFRRLVGRALRSYYVGHTFGTLSHHPKDQPKLLAG